MRTCAKRSAPIVNFLLFNSQSKTNGTVAIPSGSLVCAIEKYARRSSGFGRKVDLRSYSCFYWLWEG